MKNLTIEELWSAACTGDNETLSDYYADGGEKNRRYYSLFAHHSLLAAACRNGNMDTVDLLLENGEKLMEHERYELREVYYREVVRTAKALVDHMSCNNKNLTKKQEWLVDDLAAALAELKKEG